MSTDDLQELVGIVCTDLGLFLLGAFVAACLLLWWDTHH